MKAYQQTYRKNFSLVIIFLILITAALGGALFLAYKLTSKYVENEFASQKIEVLEETLNLTMIFFKIRFLKFHSIRDFWIRHRQQNILTKFLANSTS
jgi:two-component system, OmpR family, phosphate regulon sensor histidine kinase PhoR